MKAVANLILANAPFAPGPRLLPLTMLAPVRRPLAAPIAETASGTQKGDAVITGPNTGPMQLQASKVGLPGSQLFYELPKKLPLPRAPLPPPYPIRLCVRPAERGLCVVVSYSVH